MVQAKPGVAKTNTRRLINRLKGHKRIYNFGKSDTPGYDWNFRDVSGRWHDITHEQLMAMAPYQKSDHLYVRENFSREASHIFYQADVPQNFDELIKDCGNGRGIKWTPSIHMLKDDARIWLEVVDIRPERLQDISEADAIAEGVKLHERGVKWLNYQDEEWGNTQFIYNCRTATESFKTLWWVINGRDSWFENPWIWRIEIKRVYR